jgi:hypothetical protein
MGAVLWLFAVLENDKTASSGGRTRRHAEVAEGAEGADGEPQLLVGGLEPNLIVAFLLGILTMYLTHSLSLSLNRNHELVPGTSSQASSSGSRASKAKPGTRIGETGYGVERSVDSDGS